MATERRLARADFTLTRDYAAPVERVWGAFADEQQKLSWWGGGDAVEPGEWSFDFHVGGRDVAEGKFGGALGGCSRPWATTSPDDFLDRSSWGGRLTSRP